ncbi:phosphatidate cytidylyltransferase [Loktanella sp. SALINAS62]|uniref:phosphatidate cytidylyltransferase n=1 Tax=Loktanella sp. SALINAS62 TaxID=2706124 RepID=UPI001B8CDD4D|nr:phosphatidate cytidylyltransferase [Loktanella sp. SALINAS62]MBS1303648.1 phosphatidate cytidylyltransferase [Loktanella sp. SALINAS62]
MSGPIPQNDPGKWDDLTIRIASSAAMLVVGAAAVILGGVWFQIVVIFAVAVMIWEIWMMIASDQPTMGMILAAMTASVLSGMLTHESAWILLLFLVVPIGGAYLVKHERLYFFCFAFAVQVAGWGLLTFRMDYGFIWILWLVCVVVATDVFGYLIGRTMGGPKFWPKVSPKKTWSGTVGGWVAAGLIGVLFTLLTKAGMTIIVLSVVLSFASQMGDIMESAFKRRMKVKDSSTLIPGHGGLFDRFDALLGASLFMLLIASTFNVPGVNF